MKLHRAKRWSFFEKIDTKNLFKKYLKNVLTSKNQRDTMCELRLKKKQDAEP